MKKLILIVTIILSTLYAGAQDKREQIESARVAFISQRLNLVPAQAEKFWPVYNELNTKRQEIKKAIRKLLQASENPAISEEVLKSNLATILVLRQKELDLEKEYQGRFLLLLSARQVTDLYKAEKDFLKKMIEKLSED